MIKLYWNIPSKIDIYKLKVQKRTIKNLFTIHATSLIIYLEVKIRSS